MEEPKERSYRRLAVGMLVAALVGQAAYALISYNIAIGQRSPLGLGALAWLRVLPAACWFVVLFDGRTARRWTVGGLAFLLAMVVVYVSETQPREWFPRATRSIASEPTLPKVGQALALPPLTDIDGNVFDLATYGDRPVLLSIWRAWCVPCRNEIPDLQRLDGTETRAGPIAVIGINSEALSIQRRFRDELGVKFRLVAHEDSVAVLNAELLPTTLVVRNGHVIGRWSGSNHDVLQHLNNALRQSSPAHEEKRQ